MDNSFFTLDQGNLLIRLLLAHFISDFILQTNKMVEGKKWFSWSMILHIFIVFTVTFILSYKLWISAIIAGLHYLTDAIKYEIKRKNIITERWLFIADQFVHVIAIVFVWSCFAGLHSQLLNALAFPFETYNISIILLGYIIIVEPAATLIKNLLYSLNISKEKTEGKNDETKQKDNQKGGRMIGVFERIIILTFVLLGQYEAIGFLITGKSIIRFADRNSDLKSEYVLVGTMMSYAYAIITGVIINWLLIFQ